MPAGERPVNVARERMVRGLRVMWWPLWPAFAALTIRLGIERGCGDPYDLLPAIVGNTAWAWPLALVYVTGHAWIAAAYLITVSAAGTLAPGWRVWRGLWQHGLGMLVLMLAAMAIEYAPVSVWRILAAAAGCGP
jgi:hypothetical protein